MIPGRHGSLTLFPSPNTAGGYSKIVGFSPRTSLQYRSECTQCPHLVWDPRPPLISTFIENVQDIDGLRADGCPTCSLRFHALHLPPTPHSPPPTCSGPSSIGQALSLLDVSRPLPVHTIQAGPPQGSPSPKIRAQDLVLLGCVRCALFPRVGTHFGL